MTAPELQQPAAPVCAATGCEQPPDAGSTLCRVDTGRLGDYLAEIGSLYELLEAAPSMQGREVGTIGGTTLASQRSVGSIHVMALRDGRRGTGWVGCDDPAPDPWGFDDTPSVLGTLHGYADQVREGRELAEEVTYVQACLFPCMHRACLLGMGHPVRVPLTVASERRLLAEKNNFRWLLLQDWAGEFYDEIRGLWVLLRKATGHGAPKPQGICIDCDGPVSWQGGAATCSRCGVSTTGLAVIRRHSEPSVADGKMSA